MTSKYLRGKNLSATPVVSLTENTPPSDSGTVSPVLASRVELEKLINSSEEAIKSSQMVETMVEETEEVEIPSGKKLIPSAIRNFKLYKKVDHKSYYSPEEFNKVCIVACGDQRRIFQRLLLGIQQRAHKNKDSVEVKRLRLLIDLHERGTLFSMLDKIEGIV
jgi:hypothetical protein